MGSPDPTQVVASQSKELEAFFIFFSDAPLPRNFGEI
jgi:hypothetical protein